MPKGTIIEVRSAQIITDQHYQAEFFVF